MPVRRERHGHVHVVTLDRPEKRNALNMEMVAEFGAVLAEAADDDEVRVVLLTAEGPAFCAGMDLAEFSDASAAGSDAGTTTGVLMAFMRGTYPKPVVAGANGPAVGGGFELLLGCDLVVAAEGATFGLPEVRRGLFPGGNGTLLPSRIPLAVALEMGLTGDLMGAERALGIGLVNRVVPAGEVVAEARALAERIAGNSPLGVRTTCTLMRLSASADAARVWDAIAEAWPVVAGSDDAGEGARAYVEKRPPSWTGR